MVLPSSMGPHPDSSQWFQTSLSQGHKECQAGRREYNPRWNEKQCAKVNQRHCTRGTGRLKSCLVMSRRFRRNKASLEKSRVVSEAIQKSKETLWFFFNRFPFWFCRQDKGPAVANTSRPHHAVPRSWTNSREWETRIDLPFPSASRRGRLAVHPHRASTLRGSCRVRFLCKGEHRRSRCRDSWDASGWGCKCR